MKDYVNLYYGGWGAKSGKGGYVLIDKLSTEGVPTVININVTLAKSTTTIYDTKSTEKPFFVQIFDEDGNQLEFTLYLDSTWKVGIYPTGVIEVVTLRSFIIGQLVGVIPLTLFHKSVGVSLTANTTSIYATGSAVKPFMWNCTDANGVYIPTQIYKDGTDYNFRILGGDTDEVVTLNIVWEIFFTTLASTNPATTKTGTFNLLSNVDGVIDLEVTTKPYMAQLTDSSGYPIYFQLYFDNTWKLFIPSMSIDETITYSVILTMSFDDDAEATPLTEIKITAESLFVTYLFNDWNNPIIGLQAEFSVINNKVDFFELLPLLTAEERQYRVRIVEVKDNNSTVNLFIGYLNCDTITQKYLHLQIISFTASSYLSKLENIHPDSVDTSQTIIFINLIDEILCSTGSSYNIRVNNTLHAEGDILADGQTLFNKNGIFSEVFWQDEVTRDTSLEILTKILTSFDCYIYWWEGYWYIERYEDIYKIDKYYVEYQTGVTYGVESVGTVVHIVETIQNLQLLKFTEQSQTLSIIPGMLNIEITLKDMLLNNLVTTNLADNISIITSGIPDPPFRGFEIYQDSRMTYSNFGEPKSNIVSGIKRVEDMSVYIYSYSFLRWPASYHGITTKFRATVDNTETEVNLTFTYLIDTSVLKTYGRPDPYPIEDSGKAIYSVPFTKFEDYTFTFSYYLRVSGTNLYFTQAGDDWLLMLGNPTDEAKYVQKIEVAGSSFDPDTNSVSVSITVPIGLAKTFTNGKETGTTSGDYDLIFGIGKELVAITGTGTRYSPIPVAWFGDFVVTCSGDVQDNVITGIVNNNFLNKKSIELTLYDMISYNYLNGILRGTDLFKRTERWNTQSGANNIIQKGVCYSRYSSTPDITSANGNKHTDDGTGFEPFTSNLIGLEEGATYYVRAYIISEEGVSYGAVKQFTTLDLQIGTYYQGGFIFYFLKEGESNHLYAYDPNISHGYIVAPTDASEDEFWGSLARPIPASPQAFGKLIGQGWGNSTIILASDSQYADHAVARCDEYENEGYVDWFFPSLNELIEIKKAGIPGMAKTSYWSSSESENCERSLLGSYNYKYAYSLDFNNTRLSGSEDKKNAHRRVRAIRAF